MKKRLTMIEMADLLQEYEDLKPCTCGQHDNLDDEDIPCGMSGRGNRDDSFCCKRCPDRSGSYVPAKLTCQKDRFLRSLLRGSLIYRFTQLSVSQKASQIQRVFIPSNR